MQLVPSTSQDVERLTAWIAQDPYHKDYLDPLWWLTGSDGSLLAFRLDDGKGPTMYARLDREGDLLRLHCQFAPEPEVSKLRVVKSLLWALPKMELAGRQFGLIGFVYKSISPDLIGFMRAKFGFISLDKDDDYMLYFQSENTV